MEFVGRIVSKDKAAQLDKFPNTKFWDAKKPEELPSYLKKFDAGIIPFLKNEQTAGIYPMKINEYLAGGIPVISTDFFAVYRNSIRLWLQPLPLRPFCRL